jgi:hypothetical protein
MSCPVPLFDAGEEWSASAVRDLYIATYRKWGYDDCDIADMEPDFYGRSGREYLPLIASFGEVLLNCDLGKDSGDTFALVGAGMRVGILTSAGGHALAAMLWRHARPGKMSRPCDTTSRAESGGS